jgi:tRNA pseudouridine38-40 synthase
VAHTVRTITEARLDEGDALAGGRALTITIAGDGFLRHMVRTMVGTLVEVGIGRRSAAGMPALLASRDRSQAGPTAPPHGLTLVAVTYAEGDQGSKDEGRGTKGVEPLGAP